VPEKRITLAAVDPTIALVIALATFVLGCFVGWRRKREALEERARDAAAVADELRARLAGRPPRPN